MSPKIEIAVWKSVKYVTVAAILIFMFKLCSGDGETREARPYKASSLDAYLISQRFVKQKLKSPKSADFPHYSQITVNSQGSNTFEILSYVDATNSFNANIRSNYRCVVRYNESSKGWSCISIKID